MEKKVHFDNAAGHWNLYTGFVNERLHHEQSVCLSNCQHTVTFSCAIVYMEDNCRVHNRRLFS
jgi:hypothetical protein